MLVPSLQRYQACPLSKSGIDLCTPDFLSRSVRYQSIEHRLIERYFRVPIELRDRIRDQPVLSEKDRIVCVHAIVEQVDYRLTLGLGEAVIRRFRFMEQFSD